MRRSNKLLTNYNKNDEVLSNLNKGQRVRVTGTFIAYPEYVIVFENCKIEFIDW